MASLNYNIISSEADCVNDKARSLCQDLRHIQENMRCAFVAIDGLKTYFFGFQPDVVKNEPEKEPNCFMDEMMRSLKLSEKLEEMITLDRT